MGLAPLWFVEAAMARRPSVLCPIDFSNPSRAALRYATAIAERFRTSLTLLTVNDPLLAEAAEMRAGPDWLPEDSERELRRFFEQTFEHRTLFPIDVQIARHDRPSRTGDPPGRARAPLRLDRHEHARAHRRPQALLRRDDRTGPARNRHSRAGHAGGRAWPALPRRRAATGGPHPGAGRPDGGLTEPGADSGRAGLGRRRPAVAGPRRGARAVSRAADLASPNSRWRAARAK